ncbi:microcystin-dependent protein [Sphingomonas insulae]|uniref:Microcystin-dependent protein n=1 Tax=Sphingomonas insulae TaxID=424800 RepID=A0ABP3T3A4_9SPHN|nr:tail fiber protein [Sphingomonas insulae]NIJ29741.1 microcystin-dependent protein [Sphingomonas insulae]
MIPLKLVMTTAGLGRFTAAQSDAGVDLTVTQVAFTATAFVAAPTLTALPGEFRRVSTVSGEAAGDNLVHMTVQDDAALTYTVRGFGLFLGDGTLFATYSQPGVIAEKSSNAMLALVIDIAFPEAGVDRITFGDTNFLNPPGTTTRKGVVRFATPAERDTGIATDVALTPSDLRSALPIGTVTMWYGDAPSVPDGWAICDGREVARSDGEGTVVTPNLVGRAPVGASVAHAPGATFGASETTVSVTPSYTGASVSTTTRAVDAGGSASGLIGSVSFNDAAHSHDLTIDVTPPSIALHFIMKV